jgi:undecaprenyl-diphosphatase
MRKAVTPGVFLKPAKEKRTGCSVIRLHLSKTCLPMDISKVAAYSSALSLAISHIPVQLVKKLFPRKRPYLMIEETKVPLNPLKDHSFPSGHTTAIFSVIIPLVLFSPALSFILIPLGLCVGLSRIYLGLHYPSDVMAGGLLGSCVGVFCFLFIF